MESKYETKLYPLDISIKCNDRDLLVDIMNALSQARLVSQKLRTTYHPSTQTSVIDATILIPNVDKLNSVQKYYLAS